MQEKRVKSPLHPPPEQRPFVMPGTPLLNVACGVLRAMQVGLRDELPGFYVSLFVSEAGWRRGLAISKSPLPNTFVMLNKEGDPTEVDEATDAMLRGSMLLYLGAVSDNELALRTLLPFDDDGTLERVGEIAHELFSTLCAAGNPIDPSTHA